MSSRFEQTGEEIVHEGSFFTVVRRRFRHEDGEEVEREIVTHPGAVGIVVLDGDDLWFVRQPREAIGSPDLLELPAGKLDEEGESPLDTAKRELAEEIGKQALGWEPLGSFDTLAGFSRRGGAPLPRHRDLRHRGAPRGRPQRADRRRGPPADGPRRHPH